MNRNRALERSLISHHYRRSMMNRFSMDIARGAVCRDTCQGRLEENYPKGNFGSAAVAGNISSKMSTWTSSPVYLSLRERQKSQNHFQ
jgi:hypothetical protein